MLIVEDQNTRILHLDILALTDGAIVDIKHVHNGKLLVVFANLEEPISCSDCYITDVNQSWKKK